MAYEYDVFISYRRYRLWPAWVEGKFLPLFEHWLGEQLADWLDQRDVSIFFDTRMEKSGNWPEELGIALARSRVLVTLWSGQYFQSPWCVRELATMMAREAQCGVNGLVLPATIHGGERFPAYARQKNWVDLKKYANVRLATGSVLEEELSSVIEAWTKDIRQAIQRVPDYDPTWEAIAIERFIQTFAAAEVHSPQNRIASLGGGP